MPHFGSVESIAAFPRQNIQLEISPSTVLSGIVKHRNTSPNSLKPKQQLVCGSFTDLGLTTLID